MTGPPVLLIPKTSIAKRGRGKTTNENANENSQEFGFFFFRHTSCSVTACDTNEFRMNRKVNILNCCGCITSLQFVEMLVV